MKVRRSTLVLGAIFVVTLVVYLLVRPVPAPAVQYVPVVPEVPVVAQTTTTVGPSRPEVTDPDRGASTSTTTTTSSLVAPPSSIGPTDTSPAPSTTVPVAVPPTSGPTLPPTTGVTPVPTSG